MGKPTNQIVQILMSRDNLTQQEAENLFQDAQNELYSMIENEEDIDDNEFCYDWFGLEPDYIMELL